MPFANRFLLGVLLIILAGLLGLVFAPFAVSNGVRCWIWWKARQQKLTAEIDKIEAPLFRPVIIRGLRLKSAPEAAFRLAINAPTATIDLNLKSILTRTRGRAIRAVSVDDLRAEMHRDYAGTAISESGWVTLQKLLPNSFDFKRLNLRIEEGSTVILVRDASLSGSQIESGRFQAAELMIASPFFRQTFSELRGATNWQGKRLTLAAISLTRGLDIQSITADLSQLGKQRLGFEFDVDAFGGKIRASISNEWRSQHSNWAVAGSAAGISLAQTSEAIGFTDRMDGLLHACKFTFHGDLRDPTYATASLWMELTGLTWRSRAAEVIMLGTVFYNRQVQIQQLYVKQHENELTFSGEGSLPSKSTNWLSPDFRGDISASIDDLSSFARLFGAQPDDFAGRVGIEGAMNTRDRKIGGRLTVDGTSLTIFKTPIDLLNARLNLKAAEMEIEQLEIRRGDDLLYAQGAIGMAPERNYSGTLNATIKDVTPYLSLLRGSAPANSKPASADIQASITSSVWDVHGSINIPESSPLNFTVNFPLPFGADQNTILTAPINATLEFPAISLAHAPQLWPEKIFRDGSLSGKLSLSETLRYPKISGVLEVKDGKLDTLSLNVSKAAGRLIFNGTSAAIDPLNIGTQNVDLTFRGEVDFNDTEAIAIALTAGSPLVDLTPAEVVNCVTGVNFLPAPTPTPSPRLDQVHLIGSVFKNDWTIFLLPVDESSDIRHLDFCADDPAQPKLILGTEAQPQKRR